jgi:hypothetical protein
MWQTHWPLDLDLELLWNQLSTAAFSLVVSLPAFEVLIGGLPLASKTFFLIFFSFHVFFARNIVSDILSMATFWIRLGNSAGWVKLSDVDRIKKL